MFGNLDLIPLNTENISIGCNSEHRPDLEVKNGTWTLKLGKRSGVETGTTKVVAQTIFA
jgi:hypothetical protein